MIKRWRAEAANGVDGAGAEATPKWPTTGSRPSRRAGGRAAPSAPGRSEPVPAATCSAALARSIERNLIPRARAACLGLVVAVAVAAVVAVVVVVVVAI